MCFETTDLNDRITTGINPDFGEMDEKYCFVNNFVEFIKLSGLSLLAL
jgi:hypothetical protein